MEHASPRIHPTALIAAEAELADDVVVGAFAVVEGKVRLGPGCVVRPHAQLLGSLIMGRDNHVYANAVIGERPQHLGYRDEATGVDVGDGNTFRENVTVHRGTTHSWRTRIGDGNYFMAGSHVAHDCQVGNRCILVNNALLGGHCVLADGVCVSGNAAVHQFCRMGRLAFLSATSLTTKDVPPFLVQQGINNVVGVNVVGMRRSGLSRGEIDAVRRVYHIVFRKGLSLPCALGEAEVELAGIGVVREFIDFVRQSSRGINRARGGDAGSSTS